MTSLSIDVESEPRTKEPYYPTIYTAVFSDSYGVTDDGTYITGIELIVVRQGTGYDPLAETISMIGTEALIHPPEGGVEVGSYYEIDEICTSTDWETGQCEDTELYIKKLA